MQLSGQFIVNFTYCNHFSFNKLKKVVFIAGKSENPADQKFLFIFFIDDLIGNISLYALSWPKLNFGLVMFAKVGCPILGMQLSGQG